MTASVFEPLRLYGRYLGISVRGQMQYRVSFLFQTLGQFTITLPLVLLFIARAADGLTGGNISVANAYLADITSEEARSKNFGRMAMSSNLGFIIGPALAGLLGAALRAHI